MNHKNIQKKFLFYIDGNLPASEMNMVKEHISLCPLCSKHLDEISEIWKQEKILEEREPSPYIWKKLEKNIREYENNKYTFLYIDIKKRFDFLMRPVLLSFMLFIAIITGYYLENFLSNNIDLNADVANEQITKIFYIDTLSYSTMESIHNRDLPAYNENK
ncbi:zf-HC2 domain-containing protein [Candidatus Desantisbacteria bacterium]|nr:zf-HC2 domain-containing protein [Candidatus Desantisbacteria bacterium]